MKLMNKLGLFFLAASTVFAACEKEDALPFYSAGSAVTVTPSATSIAPPPADSNKVALTLDWTDPKYATDSATVKYIIEMDSTNRNFSKATRTEVVGARSKSFTAKELNNMLLSYGFAFGKAYDMDVRVISSYLNNNDRQVSSTVKVKMTPYKVPPKVQLPADGRLFIVGGATVGGWNNPVPVPSQELTRIDETTFGGIFQFSANGEFLILPKNGDWSSKYAIPSNGAPGVDVGGPFQFYTSGGDNFVGPKTAGLYKVTLDFQGGRYTIEPFTQQHGLPSKLVVVGGGTPQGWNNSVDNPQTFTRLNATQWQITVNISKNGEYLILPDPGNWGMKYGVKDNGVEAAKLGGFLVPEGQNIIGPNEAGNYKIEVNFFNNAYKLTKQ